MPNLLAIARDHLAALHPSAPWATLTLAIWLAVWAVRRYLPAAWALLERSTVAGSAASKLVQGLPSVLAGALVGVGASGDYEGAWKGALAGALAPLVHHFLRASPLPYGGDQKPPPGPLVTFLAAFGLTFGVGHACGGNPEVVRAPELGCDAGACPVPSASAAPVATPSADPAPTEFGALLVVLRTAEGVEHAILCGGEVSSDLSRPAPQPCPYDHAPVVAEADAGRTLLKLERDAR